MPKKFKPPVEWLPGIYDNIPHETYLGIDAARSSRLRGMLRSPAHMRYELDNPRDETEAMRIGRIVHAGVLEPTRFKKEYRVMPDYENRRTNVKADGTRSYSPNTKVVQEHREKFLAKHAGKTIISKDDEALATSARKAFMRFDISRILLERKSPIEQTILWYEDVEVEGMEPQKVFCKIRPDKWLSVEDEMVVVDVKTTTNAAPRAHGFWREIDKFRYDIQAAMYLTGLHRMSEMGLIPEFRVERFVLLAVEKEGLFAAHPHELHESWIEVGQRDFRKLLAEYAKCKASGVWPLWGTEASIAHPPHYRMQEGYDED